MTHHAAAERRELAETLRRVGPDAPTLCEPWTTADLAAHLALRGKSARYAVAMARGGEAALRRQRDLVARVGFPALIERIESIGRLSPARLSGPDDAVNLVEYVVHHEDVRRAGADWAPRSLPADRQAALWRQLRLGGRTAFRRSLAGLTLRWARDAADGVADASLSGGRPTLTVSGDPVELALVMLRRARVARVELDGPAEDIARFRERAHSTR